MWDETRIELLTCCSQAAIRLSIRSRQRPSRQQRAERLRQPPPDDAAETDAAPEELDELDWKRQLLDRLLSMPPDGFERLANGSSERRAS